MSKAAQIAKKNYEAGLWGIERINALLLAGKITEEEYNWIIAPPNEEIFDPEPESQNDLDIPEEYEVIPENDLDIPEEESELQPEAEPDEPEFDPEPEEVEE